VLAWSPEALGNLHWWGVWAVVAACLCWGIDNTCTRPASSADPAVIAAWKGAIAGTINTLLAVLLGATWPGWWPILGAAVVGLCGYGLSLVLFVLALRHLGSGRTGAYFALAPFIGALTALLLGDPPTWTLAIAGAFMALGLWLHLSERHHHEHQHDALEHDHRHTHDEHHQHEHDPRDPPGSPHRHPHRHAPLVHTHEHQPDLHHRHGH
jgi:drug/metabolite transporter (DMT)-like permease